jgi:hypothetical protein
MKAEHKFPVFKIVYLDVILKNAVELKVNLEDCLFLRVATIRGDNS